MTTADGVLPRSVTVTDITARDGFQNIEKWIPTEMKLRVLDELAAAGVRRMEAASFVSPKAVPQMKDAEQIVEHMLTKHPEVDLIALAPNLRGVENAVKAGAGTVSYIISASPPHNKANVNRTHEESLADLAVIRERFPDVRINLSMSMVFGCPFMGEVKPELALWLLEESIRRGASSVSLCDTIGVANPVQVREFLSRVRDALPGFPLSLHLHDTHGMGLANTFAALQAGVDCFETAVGGLGGCPFAPGASGNTSTEDMVNMLERMGVDTGTSLEKLLKAAETIRENINPDIPGKLGRARPYLEYCFFQR